MTQRMALIEQYPDTFGAASIETLLADREFIGTEWIDFLCEKKVPFVIRIKSELTVELTEGGRWRFKTLLRGQRIRTVARLWQGRFPEPFVFKQNQQTALPY